MTTPTPPAPDDQPSAQTGELIARLEAAEVGSRELDAEIAVITRWPPLGNIAHWVHDEEMEARQHGNIGFKNLPGNPAEWSSPLFTTSLDAALALAERVLPGWRVARMAERRETDDQGEYIGGWSVRLHWPLGGRLYNLEYGSAGTLPLALCAAILRATGSPR